MLPLLPFDSDVRECKFLSHKDCPLAAVPLSEVLLASKTVMGLPDRGMDGAGFWRISANEITVFPSPISLKNRSTNYVSR
jgi:hypothetical protein